MKALTFEEWEKLTAETTVGQGKYWRVIFDAARVGMIPEDEAVRIPPVNEWPEGAEAIYVGYYDKSVLVKRIAHIPRPAPAWTPRVGDAVFTLSATSGDIEVALVVSKDADGYKCKKARYAIGWFDVEYLKPFDASKIGKPWEEI